jgi:uncharacterized protein (DUF1015 family)
MPDVRPFRAITYHPAKVGDLAKVVAEPYDKVTESMRAAYLAASPYNIVRIDLPRESVDGKDRYETAGVVFRSWIEKLVLVRAERPAFYLYEQGFALPGGERLTRRALVGLVEAREHARGHVLPHERTFREPKADRMALLEAVRAHFGMCFLLYRDEGREVETAIAAGDAYSSPPLADFSLPDGTSHRLLPIEDPQAHAAIRRAFAERTCTIADGHHRFETAVAFRRKHEAAGDARPGFAYRTAAFVNVADAGLRILPTHRLLPPEVDAERFAAAAAPWLAPADPAAAHFVVAGKGGARRGFVLKDGVDLAKELPEVHAAVRGLDVTILHRLVLEKGLGIEAGAKEHLLGYVRWPEEGIAKVEAGAHGCLVILRPATAADVLTVAAGGAVMPQKSTDFYPKLLSGLVINDIEDETHGD